MDTRNGGGRKNNKQGGRHTTDFIIHENGAVTIDNIRYGASQEVAVCLREVAKNQRLKEYQKCCQDINMKLNYGKTSLDKCEV